jgi:hypothetical protein
MASIFNVPTVRFERFEREMVALIDSKAFNVPGRSHCRRGSEGADWARAGLSELGQLHP